MLFSHIILAFLIINAMLLFFLPKRWALLPLVVTACYIPKAQGILIEPFHFSVFRLMLFSGFLRIVLRGERFNGPMNGLDRIILLWAGWLLANSVFHEAASGAFVFRLGLVYDACGVYFLVRMFCQSMDEFVHLCKIIAIVLVPVAAEMLFEKLTAYNVFSMLGGVDEIPYIRETKVRAQGPFSHAILAGTVGAVCLPMVFSLWKLNPKVALTGTAACLMMVYASTSSGPVMSTLAAVFGLLLWRYRKKSKSFLLLMILSYIALDVVMKDPAYFIMARIDIAGGSTGWHRARLIQSSIEHLGEWWIVGTDYTRHWMETGLLSTQDQVDITNHYIRFGVFAGLPLMTLFILQLKIGFSYVGDTVRHWFELSVPYEFSFMIWALGASLFVHAVTCLSVSYFDQSGTFLYLTLAAISAAKSETFVVGKLKEVELVKKN